MADQCKVLAGKAFTMLQDTDMSDKSPAMAEKIASNVSGKNCSGAMTEKKPEAPKKPTTSGHAAATAVKHLVSGAVKKISIGAGAPKPLPKPAPVAEAKPKEPAGKMLEHKPKDPPQVRYQTEKPKHVVPREKIVIYSN